MATRLNHDALFKQGRDILGQRLGAAHVGHSNLRTLVAQKQGRRQTDFPSPTTRTFLL